MKKQFHVKKGDQVVVTTGDHKGESGKVIAVRSKKDQVIVEGVRIIKKHVRKSQENPQGAIVEVEGPIHVSNVKLVEKGEKPSGKKTKAA